MAKYFVDPDDEIIICFAYNPQTDMVAILREEQEPDEGFEEHYVVFRCPTWEEEVDLIAESSRTSEGMTLVDPFLLLNNRVKRLLKSWSFAEAITELYRIDPKIMFAIAAELGQR